MGGAVSVPKHVDLASARLLGLVGTSGEFEAMIDRVSSGSDDASDDEPLNKKNILLFREQAMTALRPSHAAVQAALDEILARASSLSEEKGEAKVGERVYALRGGSWFWPATIVRVQGNTVDLDFLHVDQDICDSERLGVRLDALTPASVGRVTQWTPQTSRIDRSSVPVVDRDYYRESDRMIALLALGSCEADKDARMELKNWFEFQYQFGTRACGEDYWTFLLAQAASTRRLRVLGQTLEALYQKEHLGERLGDLKQEVSLADDDDKEMNVQKRYHALHRCDDEGVLPGFCAFLEKHSSNLLAESVPSDGTLDAAYAVALAMLGLAIDPLFRLALKEHLKIKDIDCLDDTNDDDDLDLEEVSSEEQRRDSAISKRLTGAPVKKTQRMLAKSDTDHTDERVPRTASNLDVVRCSVEAESVDALRSDFAALSQPNDCTFRLRRCKNGWADDALTRARRRDISHHYASLLLNLLFAPPNLTFDQLAAKNLWQTFADSLGTWDRLLANAAIAYFTSNHIRHLPVLFLVEVQLQYRPYVVHGRKKTHLHYKIARATDPATLASDFQHQSAPRYAKTKHAEAAFDAATAAYDAAAHLAFDVQLWNNQRNEAQAKADNGPCLDCALNNSLAS